MVKLLNCIIVCSNEIPKTSHFYKQIQAFFNELTDIYSNLFTNEEIEKINVYKSALKKTQIPEEFKFFEEKVNFE